MGDLTFDSQCYLTSQQAAFRAAGHVDTSTAAQPPLYACVLIPEFAAQARLRLRPEHRDQPVTVLSGDPPLEEVCSVNRRARSLGVRPHMTRTELEAFEGLVILSRSLPEEDAARAALLSLANSFTPRTQLWPTPQGGTTSLLCVLDMTGSGRIFGDMAKIARRLRSAVHGLGLRPRLALSRNFHAAVCAAAYAIRRPTLIEPGQERAALANLPLAALGLMPEQQETLALWGLRTVGELTTLPEAGLIARLGQAGKRLLQLAHGTCDHLLVPEEPAPAFDEALTFEDPEERLEALLFVLNRMLGQLVLRAQAHALALASVTLTLRLDGGGEHVRTVRPALPLTDRALLLKLLQLELETHPPPAALVGVHLHAEPGRHSEVQTGLFSPVLPEPMRLDVTLARLTKLLGEGRVGRARLLDTHRPDSFAMERFSVPTQAPEPRPVRALTALRRLRPPMPLHMTLQAATPHAFFYTGKRFVVEQAHGPWRQSGDWWSCDVWSRDEWDVAATSGDERLLCVLVQDLLCSRWHLEALYD
jgi:protein ImuB